MEFLILAPIALYLLAMTFSSYSQRLNALDKKLAQFRTEMDQIQRDHIIHEFNWKPIGNKLRAAESKIQDQYFELNRLIQDQIIFEGKLQSIATELDALRTARTKQLIAQQAKPSQPTIAQVDAEFQRRQEYKELKALKQ